MNLAILEQILLSRVVQARTAVKSPCRLFSLTRKMGSSLSLKGGLFLRPFFFVKFNQFVDRITSGARVDL